MTSDDLFGVFLAAAADAQAAMGVRDEVSQWTGSPFEWLMFLPSRSRGKAGELLASAWLRRLGYDVQAPRTSGHDRTVEGVPTEIKFSTLWKSGQYVFQQLRDQDYTFALLLGVSPNAASAWFAPKQWRSVTPTPSTAEAQESTPAGYGLLQARRPTGSVSTAARSPTAQPCWGALFALPKRPAADPRRPLRSAPVARPALSPPPAWRRRRRRSRRSR